MLLELISSNMLVSAFIPVDDLYDVSVTLLVKLKAIGLYLCFLLLLLLFRVLGKVIMHYEIEILAKTIIRLVPVVTQDITCRGIIALRCLFLLLLIFLLRGGLFHRLLLLYFLYFIWVF